MMFATPSGEPHEFGILVACLVAAAQQYNCYYLGADLPAKDILEASLHLQPQTVVIGMVKTPPEPTTMVELQQIIDAGKTNGLEVWLGGAGASYLQNNADWLVKGYELITDIDHFNAKIRQNKVAI